MANIKGRGFVLREYDNGDANKNIVVLLKDVGKKYVFAKNAKNSKSKLQAGSKVFTYADYELYEGRGFMTLNETNIIKSFYPIAYDYDKFCYANVISELTEKNIMEGENCNDILQLLLKTFQIIEKNILKEHVILSVYIIRFFQLSGYVPNLDNCSVCGNLCKNTNSYFYQEGIICDECKMTHRCIKIHESTKLALNHVVSAELSKLYNFKISEEVSLQLKDISFLLLNTYSNIQLKSLQFIN